MNPQPKAVTFKDIALRAGVSHATVSRAMRNHPRISRETCAKIQKLAREMRYRPDPALASLAAYRSRVRNPRRYEKIAILSDRKDDRQLPEKLKEQLAGIRARAHELGFDTEFTPIDYDPKAQHRLSRTLYYRGIRGLVVLPLPSQLAAFNWRTFSIIGIGENIMPLGLNYLSSDHDASVCECYRQLKSRGYRNIGYANIADSEQRNRFLFYSAYLKSRALDGLPPASPLFHALGDMSGLLAWLRSGQFDAVIFSDLHILDALQGTEFKIPRTLGLAGMSFPISSASSAGISAYIIDGIRLGRLAMDILQTLIQKNQYGIPKPDEHYAIFLRGYWHEGSTVRRLPSR